MMKIIEYFTAEDKEYWLNEIGKSDWGAGQYLYQLLRENSLKCMVGETALVPMFVDGNILIAFCTFAPLDDIQPTMMEQMHVRRRLCISENMENRSHDFYCQLK